MVSISIVSILNMTGHTEIFFFNNQRYCSNHLLPDLFRRLFRRLQLIMITFSNVYDAIKAALTGRMAGTKVQVTAHENFELMLLNYVEQLYALPVTRESHASASAGTACDLFWNKTFDDTNYTYVVNGFDTKGNPVEIYIISKTASKIVVKTLVNANMTALAFVHTP